MDSNTLKHKKCVPCEGTEKPFDQSQIDTYHTLLNEDWEVVDGKKIQFRFKFKNFVESMKFINEVARMAEEEGHHPNIHVYYGEVEIELWTHAINGLSENDFILAKKIEDIQI